MKRLLPLFLAVILCFTFVGCSEANDQTPQAESPSETITQKNNFEAWLIGTKNYSSRGEKDVISRCKRAEKMVPSKGKDEAHYIFALEQNEEFHCLSVNVRSQIKRAIKLKTEYETS